MRHDGNVTNNPSDNEPRLIVVQSPSSPGADGQPPAEERETVELPAKVMRIGSMIRQLLDEVRQAPLDEASRIRLRQVYDTSLRELQEGLSPDLSEELKRMAPPFHPESVPTDSELRVAQAQLVGWLEGLFHGIQATFFSSGGASARSAPCPVTTCRRQRRARGRHSGPRRSADGQSGALG
jgi:hypothetical protein